MVTENRLEYRLIWCTKYHTVISCYKKKGQTTKKMSPFTVTFIIRHVTFSLYSESWTTAIYHSQASSKPTLKEWCNWYTLKLRHCYILIISLIIIIKKNKVEKRNDGTNTTRNTKLRSLVFRSMCFSFPSTSVYASPVWNSAFGRRFETLDAPGQGKMLKGGGDIMKQYV